MTDFLYLHEIKNNSSSHIDTLDKVKKSFGIMMLVMCLDNISNNIKYYRENPGSIYMEDKNRLNVPQRDWASEQTLIDFVANILQHSLNIYNFDGSLRFRARPFEELTIIEEGFP